MECECTEYECVSVRINQVMLQEQLQTLDGLKQSDFMSHSCGMSLGLSRAVLCVIGFTPGPRQTERVVNYALALKAKTSYTATPNLK